MFLEVLRRRNAAFVDAVVSLHQQGVLPANAYTLDLDTVRLNAQAIRAEADRQCLEVFAMTKQVGRAPGVLEALRGSGIESGVAVDMTDARALRAGNMQIGNIGHLVQIAQAEAAAAAALEPQNWTVFSEDKAREAAAAGAGERNLLARIQAPGDVFYEGHEGGFLAADIVPVAELLDGLDGARFAGITTFPALLFDASLGEVLPTPNLATLETAATRLRDTGVANVRINAPGTNSAAVFALLAERGATQVEPGHALTGTTPLHGVRDLVELPAVCYVTEVSHVHGGRAYAFGGGLYVDPVFPPYRLRALVAERPGEARLLDASIPPPEAIDYYAQLDPAGAAPPRTGATVVFGFRIQAFVTRAYVVGVSGVASGQPQVTGIWSTDGKEAPWP
jgi:predicted amino acid racemase